MSRIIVMCVDSVLSAALLAPVFWVLNKRYFQDAKRSIWYFLLAVYLCEVIALVGLPNIGYVRLDFNINLKPFAYMFSDYRSSSLNVLLFLPLGFFLPVLWEPFKKVYWTMLFGFCTSLLIELLQIFTFRATDVNDLMTNTTGTLLGWCIGRLALRLIPGLTPKTDTQHVYAICAISFAVMFFVQPLLSEEVIRFLLY